MNNFKTLSPLYYTAQGNPQRLGRIMHQALALMVYKNIKKHQPDLKMIMYFNDWLDDHYYHRKSAIQTALFLRKYFRLQKELDALKSQQTSFWRRQRLGYELFCLEHRYISVSDVLNYSCYLFVKYKYGTQEQFFAFLDDVLQKPDLYFEK